MKEPWARNNEISIINDALIHYPTHNSHIYYFHGKSGVGKSTLSKYILQNILPNNESNSVYVFLDMQYTDVSTELRALRFLYETLCENYSFSFPNYELACAYLARTRKNKIFELDITKRISESLFEFLNLINELIPEDVISVSVRSILLFICSKVYGQGTSLHEHVKEKRLIDNLDDINLENYLTDFFIHDFNTFIENHNINPLQMDDDFFHVIFLLDSFEKRTHSSFDDWFVERLLPGMHGSIWFIFGTEETPSFITNGVEVSTYEIKKFSRDETEGYLCDRGIQENIRAIIYDKSDGLPAAITLLEEIYQREGYLDEQLCSKGYQTLFYTYFNKHLDAASREIIKKLSVFKWWDRSIFNCISQSTSEDIFNHIIKNFALVEKIHGRNAFRLISIVRDTILSIFDKEEDSAMRDGYKAKYLYFKGKTSEVISRVNELRKTHKPISRSLYDQLERFSIEAFDGAVNGYSEGTLEFKEYSTWCIETEQFLTSLGFFDLKAKLINIYLNGVMKRDGFRFDNRETRFFLNALRDLVWSYRNTGQWSKAIDNAGNYYTESLKRYGAFDVHIPFCLYLLGLTFRDVYDLETASFLFEQSIALYSQLEMELKANFESQYGNDVIAVERALHPDSDESVKVLAGNLLGYNKIDKGDFMHALTQLEVAQNLRINKESDGQRTGYSNLAKLYFCWAQSDFKEKNDDETIDNHLKMAYKYLEDARKVPRISEIERVHIDCRKIFIELEKQIIDTSKLDLKKELAEWNIFYVSLVELKTTLLNFNQPATTIPFIICVDNNLSVVCALQKNYKKSKELLSNCINQSYQYYTIENNSYDNQTAFTRINQCIAKRPIFSNVMANFKTIKLYIENPDMPFDPRAFTLIF